MPPTWINTDKITRIYNFAPQTRVKYKFLTLMAKQTNFTVEFKHLDDQLT